MSFLTLKEKEIIEAIVQRIGEVYGISRDELMSHTRQVNVARARQLAFYLLRKRFHFTMPAIGSAFDRDHTTVMHGVANVQKKDLVPEAMELMEGIVIPSFSTGPEMGPT